MQGAYPLSHSAASHAIELAVGVLAATVDRASELGHRVIWLGAEALCKALIVGLRVRVTRRFLDRTIDRGTEATKVIRQIEIARLLRTLLRRADELTEELSVSSSCHRT